MGINGIFSITTPKIYCDNSFTEDENIKKVISILNKYNMEWDTCDTISGSFSLNQEWIEMINPVKMHVEWHRVTVLDWSQEDVDIFTELAFSGNIIIRVHEIRDGEYIPNH